jgi:glutamate dehydrogenase
MASLMALRSAPDLVEISAATKLPMDAAASVYFSAGAALSLDWLREQIENLGVEGHWQAVARTTLRDNIYNLQRVICLQVLEGSTRARTGQMLDPWLARKHSAVDYVRHTVNDMRSLPAMDFATLSVALQAVRRLTES